MASASFLHLININLPFFKKKMSHEMTIHINENLPQIAKEGIPEKVTIKSVI